MPLYALIVLITVTPEEAAAATAEQHARLRELRAAGRLRGAGEFARGDGFLELFAAADLFEAEELARHNPFVAAGLGSWTLREYREV
ncbi:MAG TPA: YciI family protein [Candidatus Polarisedimenticolaceae bacterium]|nr:YciI family protein [Candidatus Polarisedimenticolaceae bacterium]